MDGVCPVCTVIFVKDQEIARLQEKIEMLRGTIDTFYNP